MQAGHTAGVHIHLAVLRCSPPASSLVCQVPAGHQAPDAGPPSGFAVPFCRLQACILIRGLSTGYMPTSMLPVTVDKVTWPFQIAALAPA